MPTRVPLWFLFYSIYLYPTCEVSLMTLKMISDLISLVMFSETFATENDSKINSGQTKCMVFHANTPFQKIYHSMRRYVTLGFENTEKRWLNSSNRWLTALSNLKGRNNWSRTNRILEQLLRRQIRGFPAAAAILLLLLLLGRLEDWVLTCSA